MQRAGAVGITGEIGAGKTEVSRALLGDGRGIYCGLGEVYLAVARTLSAKSTAMVDVLAYVAGAIGRGEIELVPSGVCPDEFPRTVVLWHGVVIEAQKTPHSAAGTLKLSAIPQVNDLILELAEDFVNKSARLVVLDGRQAWRIARHSVYLEAEVRIRIGRVQRRDRLSFREAQEVVRAADARDASMNDEARHVLRHAVVDTTLLSPAQVLQRVIDVTQGGTGGDVDLACPASLLTRQSGHPGPAVLRPLPSPLCPVGAQVNWPSMQRSCLPGHRLSRSKPRQDNAPHHEPTLLGEEVRPARARSLQRHKPRCEAS